MAKNREKNYDYVLYHKNCLDGYSSMIVLCHLNVINRQNTIIYGDAPTQKSLPPDIKNKKIIIVDVAYKPNIIKNICKEAEYVTYIDHHPTYLDEIINMNIPNLQIIKNTRSKKNVSACRLTWKYFSSEPVPKILKYISDSDTGTYQFKHTSALITTIKIHYKMDMDSIDSWYELLKDEIIKKHIRKGKIYMNYTNHLLEESLSKNVVLDFPSKKLFNKYPNVFKKPCEYKIALHNGACPTTTLVGNFMVRKLNNVDIVIVYSYNVLKRKYMLGLRSKTVDVAKIAKGLGGGGHGKAAACEIRSDEFHIEDLFEISQKKKRIVFIFLLFILT